jgi:hypothetical protein
VAELPGYPHKTKLLGWTGTYDLILAPLAVVAGYSTAYGCFWNNQPVRGWLFSCATTLALGASVVKAWITLRGQMGCKVAHELEGCLHTLHAILMSTADSAAPDPGLRITVHKPVKNGEQLEQILDYVGASRSRAATAGRRQPATAGIIGVAMTRQQTADAKRTSSDYEAYVQELQREWRYTEEQARALNPASMSWLAIPLMEVIDGRSLVRGIVYLDSTDPEFFTADRKLLAETASKGIARFLKSR